MLKSPIKGGQKNRKNGSSTGWPRIRGWGISQNRGPPGPQNRGPGGPKWLKMDAKWGQMTPYAHVSSAFDCWIATVAAMIVGRPTTAAINQGPLQLTTLDCHDSRSVTTINYARRTDTAARMIMELP